MIETSVASFDGTDIWFSDTQGVGPVVLLLHGVTMTSVTNFDTRFGSGDDGQIGPVSGPTVASALRGAGARVVSIDGWIERTASPAFKRRTQNCRSGGRGQSLATRSRTRPFVEIIARCCGAGVGWYA